MNSRLIAGLSLGALVLVACHDSPPASQPGEQKETNVNRVHREVKENLGEAAGKTKNAVESVRKEVHKGAEKAGEELGVRPAVVDRPGHADGGTH